MRLAAREGGDAMRWYVAFCLGCAGGVVVVRL